MVRICHVSDTHSQPSIFTQADVATADMFLFTGDIIGNRGRLNGMDIDRAAEIKYQQSWWRKVAKRWATVIGTRPVVVVRGNHDFISPAGWLRHYGVEVYEITDTQPMVEVCGHRFAGFRQVEWIAGEWSGEAHDLAPFVAQAFDCDPDILVTHCPPAGILDGSEGYGCRPLASALAYRPNRITHHFFGHCHDAGGEVRQEMGIIFVNGAEHCIIHEIP